MTGGGAVSGHADRITQTPIEDRRLSALRLYRGILERAGHAPAPGSTVLDFGCGDGGFVQTFFQHGFDAYGCDLSVPDGNERLREIVTDPYLIPFPDDTFDFVVSEQVFEHVTNLHEAIREMARVLRPDGASLHIFPSRYRAIECHVNVPLAGVVNDDAWLRLWARLGIRNHFQRAKHLDAEATVRENRHFLDSMTNYQPKSAIQRAFAARFSTVRFVESHMLATTESRARVLAPIARLVAPVYSGLHMRAVLASKPL